MSIILIFFLPSISVVAMIFSHRGIPGSSRDIGWKMTGIWRNPSNLRVMLHSQGTLLKGHMVLPEYANEQPESSLVIKELQVKPLWRWNDGTFVEPGSREEHRVRLRLKGSHTLSVLFLSENKTEEWKLVDPL